MILITKRSKLAYREENNNIYFESDWHFVAWCIEALIKPRAHKDANNDMWCDYSFELRYSKLYEDAIKAGQKIIIEDKGSEIVRKGCVAVEGHLIDVEVSGI